MYIVAIELPLKSVYNALDKMCRDSTDVAVLSWACFVFFIFQYALMYTSCVDTNCVHTCSVVSSTYTSR